MRLTRKKHLIVTAAAVIAIGPLSMAPTAVATGSAHHAPSIPAAGGLSSVTVWANNVNVHTGTHLKDPVVGHVGPGIVDAYCQRQGDEVHYDGYSNNWWVNIPQGWINGVFIKGGSNDESIHDVLTCPQ
jgi:hypothetical protein